MTEQKNASTLTPDQIAARSVREAQRGRVRDADGKIVFTKEQLEVRINHFKVKQEDYKKRLENIKIEIQNAEEELKNK